MRRVALEKGDTSKYGECRQNGYYGRILWMYISKGWERFLSFFFEVGDGSVVYFYLTVDVKGPP